MKPINNFPFILCVCVVAWIAGVLPVSAQTTNADFQQALTNYQQSHSKAAAEQVIKLAAGMEQLPPIPEEARRHFVRGTVLFKEAKSPEDFKQVNDEFHQAITNAPWWPEARYNRALALEAAGHYTNAIINLKLYQWFKLPEAEARAVQDKIYALEAKQEKAARDAHVKTQAEEGTNKLLRAEETRRQQSKEVLASFKRNVAGRKYSEFVANFENPDLNLHGGVSYQCVGVNEREFSGRVWWAWRGLDWKFVFTDERILFGTTGSENPDYVGTPDGPEIQDIVWEQPEIKYSGHAPGTWDGKTMKRRVWAKFSEESGSIWFSDNRPTDNSQYDPATRYQYTWYKAR